MRWLRRLFANQNSFHETRSIPPNARVNAARIELDAGGGIPEWLRVVPIGDFPNHPDGAHSITGATLDEMARNFSAGSGDLLFDYDHSSIYSGSTRAAGWGSEIEVRDDGLYVRRPEWTPPAREAITNREWRYLSPVYFFHPTEGAKLHSVALTNDPYFNRGEIDSIGNSGGPATPPAKTKQSKNIMERDELIQHLGLDKDVSDEDVEAAAKAKSEPAETPKIDAKIDEPSGDGQDTELSALEIRIKQIEDAEKERVENDREAQAEALVDAAVNSGKIRSAEKQVYANAARRDFAGTKKILDERKANSALPGRLEVDADKKPGSAKVNARQSLVDHLKAQRKAAA